MNERRGHDVTFFSAEDAQTSARLHPACSQELRLAGKQELGGFLQLPMLSDVYENADDFDCHSFPYRLLLIRFRPGEQDADRFDRARPPRSSGPHSNLFALQDCATSLDQRWSAKRLPPLLKKAASGWPPRVCADFFNARPAHLRHGDCALHVTALVPGEMHLDALASNRKHQGFAFAHQ
jgi:hypothetical protein